MSRAGCVLVLVLVGCAPGVPATPGSSATSGGHTPPSSTATPGSASDPCDLPDASPSRTFAPGPGRDVLFSEVVGPWILRDGSVERLDPDGVPIATIDLVAAGAIGVTAIAEPDYPLLATLGVAGDLRQVDIVDASSASIDALVNPVATALTTTGRVVWSADTAGALVWTFDGSSDMPTDPLIAPNVVAISGDRNGQLRALGSDGVVTGFSEYTTGILQRAPALDGDLALATLAAGAATAGTWVDLDVDACGNVYALESERNAVWRLGVDGVAVELASALLIGEAHALALPAAVSWEFDELLIAGEDEVDAIPVPVGRTFLPTD